MNSFLTHFLFGLRKYCGQFPTESDLPDFAQNLPTANAEAWKIAFQLNYGKNSLTENPVLLHSVFEFLKTGKSETQPYGFHPLSLDEQHIFPNGGKSEFKNLVEGFKSEWIKLTRLNAESFTDTLIFLSKKYFSNAGCSPDLSYVSLHEHLKTTAALADCLQRSENQQVLLVGAGLDNIQGFCYDIASSKAAKSLKGRSFFLQMLLDTLQQEIIHHPKVDACLGHVIYARGGKMYLLLPDNSDCQDALKELSRNLSEKFWRHFKASLHGFLEFEKLCVSEIDASAQAWRRLDNKIRATKNRRWADLFNPMNFDEFFNPIPEGGNNLDANTPDLPGSQTGKKMCRVTGEIIEKPSAANLLEEDRDSGQKIWVTEFVKFQADLAEGIRDADQYFWLRAKDGQQVRKEFFTGSETFISLPDDAFSGRNWNALRDNFQKQIKWSINKTIDFLPELSENMSYGFVFYGGNEQATMIENGAERVKFFHELAGLESDTDKGKGFHRLGVCRMDADRMGDMAWKATSSVALNASFSARLDLFLSGYINEIRRSRKEYREFLNILFAGGDDLLIVGRWDLVIDFARDLQQGFQRYIGGDFLTLSGGMAMVTSKFPIAKAVEMAGEAEDEAKKQGNAFTLLGEVVSWKDEFEFVQSFSKKLETWLAEEQSGISSSFIFKIYQFNRMKAAGEPHWRWLSAWYFQQAEKDNPRSHKIFDSLKRFVFTDKWTFENEPEVKFPDRALPLLTLAGKITDLKTRKNSKSDKI